MNSQKSLTSPYSSLSDCDESDKIDKILAMPVGRERLLTKFTHEQQIELIKLIAKGYTASPIQRIMKSEFNVDVTRSLISGYRRTKKWKPMIRELRAYYRDNLADVGGAHKSVRIRRMEFVQDQAIARGDLKTAVSTNDQMRKEFDGDKIGEVNIFHNNPVYQQFNSLSNEELIKRQKEATLKLIQRRENGPDRTAEENKG